MDILTARTFVSGMPYMRFHFTWQVLEFGVLHPAREYSVTLNILWLIKLFMQKSQQFVAMLQVDEHYCCFQQDSVTCHTSIETIMMFCEFFNNQLIFKVCGHQGCRICLPQIFFCWAI